MRVLYFGTPEFATPTLAALLSSSHHVGGVVTQPDRARGRGQHVTFAPVKALAIERGLPVFQPERLKPVETLDAIAAFGADIGVLAAYGKLLPQSLLDLFPRGLINVHASLLPRWRGAAPIHRAIHAGDAMTGVTIMRVVLALDAGPMLSRVEVPIDENITSVELEHMLSHAGGALLVETLTAIENGMARETPQDESRVTYAAKIEKRDAQIDWTRSARDIHNQIRGLHPWPLTSVMWRGKRLILRASRLRQSVDVDQDRDVPNQASAEPGTILGVSGDALIVATGDGRLNITEVQLEGRRPQSAREFINGARPAVGDQFEAVVVS